MAPAYLELYDACISSALAMMRGVSGIQHPTVKGSLREFFVDTLIRPMLPRTYGIGTGVIVDAYGMTAESGQEDLIVYDPESLPPVFELYRTGVFPIESTLATIEVKSSLDVSSLVNNMRRLLKIYALWPHPHIFVLRQQEAEAPEGKQAKTEIVVDNGQLAYMQHPYMCAFGLNASSRVSALHKEAADALCSEAASGDLEYDEDVLAQLQKRHGPKWYETLYPYVLLVSAPGQGCSRCDPATKEFSEERAEGSKWPDVAAFVGRLGAEAQFRKLSTHYRIPTLYLWHNLR
jgi:hypothetical protein